MAAAKSECVMGIFTSSQKSVADRRKIRTDVGRDALHQLHWMFVESVEDVLRKISPSTKCLYSPASMLERQLVRRQPELRFKSDVRTGGLLLRCFFYHGVW